MKTLAILFVRPRVAALRLREHPRWLLPFSILAIMHVLVLVLNEQQTVNAVLDNLPPTASEADRAEVATTLSGGLHQQLLFQPVRLFIGWSTFAGILFLFVRALKPREPVPYVCLFAFEVHAESVLVVGLLASHVHSLLVPASPDSAALVFPFSVSWLFPAARSFPLLALLSSINIFTLWYAAIIAAGVRVLCGLTLRNAVIVAAGAWALSLLFNIGILTLLVDTLHLQV